MTSLKEKLDKFEFMLTLIYLAIIVISELLLIFKVIGENDNILLFAMGSIPLFYIIISIIKFDKNHKIISSLTIILLMYFIYKYTNAILNFINTTFENDLIRRLQFNSVTINILYAVLTFILAPLFVKASEYIKTVQEEDEEK